MKEYLSVKEVAEKLGFSRQTVLTWIKMGRLKAKRFGKGKVYKIHYKDLEEFERR